MISFSVPARFDAELEYLDIARKSGTPWGGGEFYSGSRSALVAYHPCQDALMTQSCTSALELAALAIDIRPGDEVIVPSYTFVSSANAFALRGAKIVFADSRPMDLNLDLDHVESLINDKTKALVVVHYGGVACDMERVMSLSKKHGFFVVEDAAQAIGASHNGVPLGTIGHFGALSFHGTKNVSSGEGGALLINSSDEGLSDSVRIAHEKGTDRARFLSGQVDKYTWRSLGGSFTPSEFTMAILKAQLESIAVIQNRRASYYCGYEEALKELEAFGVSVLAQNRRGANHHMFALILNSNEEREKLRSYLQSQGVIAASHYEPLHLSPFGASQFGTKEPLKIATSYSARILRLPMWSDSGLPVSEVSDLVLKFFKGGIQ